MLYIYMCVDAPGLLEVDLGDDFVVLEIAEAGAGKIGQQPLASSDAGDAGDWWLKPMCNQVEYGLVKSG